MTPMIAVHQLVKRYNGVAAVKGISFDVKEGEIFSLLGPNGAGKTTTISVLSTLLPPSEGDAAIAGYSVARQPMAVRRLIGVVPQELALYEDLSARENLLFWGRMYGLSGRDLHRRVEEVLALVGLAERSRDRVKTYSGGMKRRLNIGVGLLHRPRVLFLDEPTVGIDPQSRRAILDSVKALNAEGMTILYTTHYMEEAQELSHRVGIMDHGELIALGTQAELTRQVGQCETLLLHIGEAEDPQALAQALQSLPGVQQATATDHQVAVITADAAQVLAPVVARAEQRGIKIHSVDIQEPNLEAVFLHLTGRGLRDR
ncbi:MAG: ATP-binding cassette domain-containing protein [Caldilineales bacterium]|nr:ATP-binding cassette domain-containing protein [Caldilineales bacterium]